MAGPDSFWSFGSAVPSQPEPARLARGLQPGDRVGGRYLVQGVLGRGAFAVVYAGEESATGRPVALKLLESVQPAALARLLREARLLARLRHPALLRILDALDHEGRLVLVLERVDGPTLEQRLDEVELDEGLALLEQVARALGEAHRHGVVHRDVKPNNVLLGADGPRLADFGLARAQQPSSLTQTGELIGTPRYMAPEQLLGAEVGPPADVWALGVILFRLLSGRLPFRAPTLQAQADLVRKGAPLLASLGVEVTPELDAVCQRALDPDPSRRFPNGEAFAAALALAQRQLAAPAPAGSSQLGMWIGLALLAAALGVGARLVRGVAVEAPAQVQRPNRSPESTPAPATPASATPASATPAPATPAPAPPSPAASEPDQRALAEAAWKRRDLDQARIHVTRAIEQDPGGGRFEDFSARVLLNLEVGDREAARADAKRALTLEAQGGVAGRLGLGVALASLEEFELALGVAERALALVEHPQALFLRAQCRDELRLPGAEADLDRALELVPGDSMLLYLRGAIRLEEGRADEALEDLERVEPDDFFREPWAKALAKARRLAAGADR